MQQKSRWSFGRRFCLAISVLFRKDTQSPPSVPRLSWGAAPMQTPSQSKGRVGDGVCLKHELWPPGDNQTAWGRETCSSSSKHW